MIAYILVPSRPQESSQFESFFCFKLCFILIFYIPKILIPFIKDQLLILLIDLNDITLEVKNTPIKELLGFFFGLPKKNSRSEAYKLEIKLKNLSRKRTIEFIIKYKEDIAGTDELLFIKQLSEC